MRLCGISPFSKADKVPDQKIGGLTQAIQNVLSEAEKHMLKNFPDTISEKETDCSGPTAPDKKQTLSGEPADLVEIDKRKTYYADSQQLFQ